MSSACAPSSRRCVPVKVADVPLEERRDAAIVAIRREPDPVERARIWRLAEYPGELVAWIAA